MIEEGKLKIVLDQEYVLNVPFVEKLIYGSFKARVQNVAMLKRDEEILSILKPDGALASEIENRDESDPSALFSILVRNKSLFMNLHDFYSPAEYLQWVAERVEERARARFEASGKFPKRSMEDYARSLIGKATIDSPRYNEDKEKSRIVFFYPPSSGLDLSFYDPHPSFNKFVDFLVSQESPRTKAQLCRGAYIKDRKVHQGSTCLGDLNCRPLTSFTDPIRLLISVNSGRRTRTQLIYPSDTPVLRTEGMETGDYRNFLTALMDFKGYTFEEGIVVSESAAQKLCHIRPENISVYSIHSGIGTRDVIPSKKVMEVIKESKEAEEASKRGESIVPQGRQITNGEELLRFRKEVPSKKDPREWHLKTIRMSKAICRWSAKSGILTSAKCEVMSSGIVDEEILNAVLFCMDAIDDPSLQSSLEELVKELQSTPLENHKGYLQAFLEEKNVEYLSVLLGAKVVEKWSFQVLWAVQFTPGAKLFTMQAWKGVCCKIVPDEDMPKLPHNGNWVPAEILISPSKIRKRKIPSLVIELFLGRLGCHGPFDPFDNLLPFAVEKCQEADIDLEGDRLRLKVDSSFYKSLRKVVEKRLQYHPTLNLASKELYGEGLENKEEFETWIQTHNEFFSNNEVGEISLPFKTGWGVLSWCRAHNDPRVSYGKEVFTSHQGLSMKTRNVRLGLHEAMIASKDLPEVYSYASNTGRGREQFMKLRRSIVRGDKMESTNEVVKALSKLGVSVPEEVLSLWSVSDKSGMIQTVNLLSSSLKKRNDETRNLLEPGQWGYYIDGSSVEYGMFDIYSQTIEPLDLLPEVIGDILEVEKSASTASNLPAGFKQEGRDGNSVSLIKKYEGRKALRVVCRKAPVDVVARNKIVL